MFLKITKDIVKDIVNEIKHYMKNNLILIVNLLYLALPYLMFYFGKANEINEILIALIPIVVIAVIYYIKAYANKIGKGKTLPVPVKRFTSVNDDGEASIEVDRVQELILYMADLEDWLERKGIK